MRREREPGHVPTSRELFASIAWRTAAAQVVLATVLASIGALTSTSATVWGLLIGVGIAGAAMGLTVLVMILTERVGRVSDMAALLGSYLIKMVLLFIVLTALKGSSFINEMALLLGFAAAVLVSLTVSTVTIARTRA